MSEKVETLDFVKDFQEYLTQQTQHVNMISGSVGGEREAEMLQGGKYLVSEHNVIFYILR